MHLHFGRNLIPSAIATTAQQKKKMKKHIHFFLRALIAAQWFISMAPQSFQHTHLTVYHGLIHSAQPRVSAVAALAIVTSVVSRPDHLPFLSITLNTAGCILHLVNDGVVLLNHSSHLKTVHEKTRKAHEKGQISTSINNWARSARVLSICWRSWWRCWTSRYAPRDSAYRVEFVNYNIAG